MPSARCPLALAILAAGCSSLEPIEADDSVLLSALHGRVYLDREAPQPSWFADARAFSGSGSDSQGLDAGETLVLDGQPFVGPGKLELDYGVRALQLGLGHVRRGESAAAAWLAGIEWNEAEVEISAPPRLAERRFTSNGLFLGVDFEGEFAERWSCALRWTFSFSISGDETFVQLIDAGLAFEPWRWARLNLGWGYLTYDRTVDSGSDLDLTLSGPLVGLSLRW